MISIYGEIDVVCIEVVLIVLIVGFFYYVYWLVVSVKNFDVGFLF